MLKFLPSSLPCCYQAEEARPERNLKASLPLGSVLSDSWLLICKAPSLEFSWEGYTIENVHTQVEVVTEYCFQ